jgi:hypothetical protein
MSFSYPKNPNPEDKTLMKGFLEGLTRFYPCIYCRKHFVEDIQKHPPNLDSKKDFVLWTCEIHNVVNEQLNKPKFNCDYQELKKRWFKND